MNAKKIDTSSAAIDRCNEEIDAALFLLTVMSEKLCEHKDESHAHENAVAIAWPAADRLKAAWEAVCEQSDKWRSAVVAMQEKGGAL